MVQTLLIISEKIRPVWFADNLGLGFGFGLRFIKFGF
jgi:hypothetical protein